MSVIDFYSVAGILQGYPLSIKLFICQLFVNSISILKLLVNESQRFGFFFSEILWFMNVIRVFWLLTDDQNTFYYHWKNMKGSPWCRFFWIVYFRELYEDQCIKWTNLFISDFMLFCYVVDCVYKGRCEL